LKSDTQRFFLYFIVSIPVTVIGLDEINNDRTNTTHNDTSSMQVHQRLTTISTFAPGGKIFIGALFCLKGQNVTKRCFDKTEVMDLVLGKFFISVLRNQLYNL
jgi:hypothetical protein